MYPELSKAVKKDSGITQFVNRYDTVTKSPDLRSEADKWLSERMRISGMMSVQYDMGLEKGLKQGLKQGVKQGEQKAKLDMARDMLRGGVSDDIVAQYTKLSPAVIESLKSSS